MEEIEEKLPNRYRSIISFSYCPFDEIVETKHSLYERFRNSGVSREIFQGVILGTVIYRSLSGVFVNSRESTLFSIAGSNVTRYMENKARKSCTTRRE